METSSTVFDPIEILKAYLQADHEMYDLSGNIIGERRIQRDKTFADNLRALMMPHSEITWKMPELECDYSIYSRGVLLRYVIPLTGLKIMASLSGSEFGISFLTYHYKLLNYWMQDRSAVFKDREFLNISDILEGVNFLLDQKEIQEQLGTLPEAEGVEFIVTQHITFTQEKLAQLLVFCRWTSLELGHAIFVQNESKIQVTPSLLIAVVSWPSSDEIFEWCAKKWMAKNPDQPIHRVLLLSVYQRCFVSLELALTERIAAFRSSLKRILILNKNMKWEKVWSVPIPIPLAGLETMESLVSGVFDVSLLQDYYNGLVSYSRDSSKEKEIVNIKDIVDAVEFLLNKKEIKEQLHLLPEEEHYDISAFTQEKFSELLFLCRELGKEQGRIIFEYNKSAIRALPSLLASVVSWDSSAVFEECIEQLGGNLPEGVVGRVTRKYIAEVVPYRHLPVEKLIKEKAAYECLEQSLLRISAASQEKPIICAKNEFFESSWTEVVQNKIYLTGVLPIHVLKGFKEKFNIQADLPLFWYYLKILASDGIKHTLEKIENRHVLLEPIQFLMQELDMGKLINALETREELYIGLVGMMIIQNTTVYETIYKKLCLRIHNMTQVVQEEEIALLLEIANKHKNIEILTLVSTHPYARITDKFLKISSKTNYYEGLSCVLKQRPEFLDKLPISNTLVLGMSTLKINLQQRLQLEGEKQGVDEKELQETFETLSLTPGIYIPDMIAAVIKVIQHKQLLHCSTQEMIELEFGNFLSMWHQKGIAYSELEVKETADFPPEVPVVGKNAESLFGSFYGYKPELYTYLVSKLNTTLTYRNQELPMYLKQFCFKLAVLLPNQEEVDVYIAKLVAKSNKDNDIHKVIFEAGDFKIPTQGYWDIEAWFSFVKRNEFKTKCMAFLRAASDIDMKMRLGDTIFSILHRAVSESPEIEKSILNSLRLQCRIKDENLWEMLIKQCPLAYENLIQGYLPKLKRKFGDEIRAREEIKRNLSKQGDRFKLLIDNLVKIYDLRKPSVTLPTLIALRLKDFPGLSASYQEVVMIALENGYSNEDIKNMIAYLNDNKQVFTFVPSVRIDGKEIEDDYNKYELVALEKTDPMAMVAGLMTSCCQHYLGDGRESAMHAYNSVYGITYRLASKKDPNQGDWFAQSWTVLSECGTILLFDSIEFSMHADEKMVVAFFKKAAEKLLIQNPHLEEIWVGHSQHTRLKLEKYGYTRTPRDKDFSIAGYSQDSYTDADSIVVLMTRKDLKAVQEEASVVVHLPAEVKQTQEEQKINSEYQLRYGVDTYLNQEKVKVVKLLGLSTEARRILDTTYAPVMALLREEPQNPLVEEGFVSSDFDQDSRYREGEYYITYEVAKRWVNTTLNSKIHAFAHHVYVGREPEVAALLREAQQNMSIKTFTLVAFLDIHAVSIFVDLKNKVSFILDSEPGTDLTHLIQECKRITSDMRVIMPESELCLQRDFYSCVTFALKFAQFGAKKADAFSLVLINNKSDTLATEHMPAELLKMAQKPLELSEKQKNTIVSIKKNLSLLQYYEQHKFTKGDSIFNTAALKTRQSILKQVSKCM